MATQAGSIQSIQSGKFFAKDENGNVRELNQGDAIYENDTVYGDNSNASSAKVEILLAGDDVIVLNQGQKQLIDSSLIETAFGTEELYFTREALEQKIDASNAQVDVESDLRAAKFKNDANITEEETTEGEEELEEEEQAGGQFAARDGALTDVESDLRKKTFPKTQTFKEFEKNDGLLDLSSKSLGASSNPFENSNTRNPGTTTNPNPNTPTRPESEGPSKNIDPTPPTVITPPTVTPPTLPTVYAIITGPGSVIEGNITTEYTVNLVDKNGNPVIVTKDTTVIVKYTNITTQNEDTQYKNGDSITVIIKAGTSSATFTIATKDDYIADNGEQFNVKIDKIGEQKEFSKVLIGDPKDGSKTNVTTTIYDNSKADGNTPHDPNKPDDHITENNKEIVVIKLFAIDKDTGDYKLFNYGEEIAGETTKYIALAFKESTYESSIKNMTVGQSLDKNLITELPQVGKVEITFADESSTGINATGDNGNTSTTTDGTQDYNNNSQTVKIGEVFQTEIFKDNVSDLEERFQVKIDSSSYQKDDRGSYESVKIDLAPVETLIKQRLFAKIEADTDSVVEGTPLKYKITIVDEEGNPVNVLNEDAIVHLKYKGISTNPADDNDYTKALTVTITKDTNFEIFEIPTIKDIYAEGDEKLEIEIDHIVYTADPYAIKPSLKKDGAKEDATKVQGTITDNDVGDKNEDNTVYAVITGDTIVNEGNEASYTVKLVDKNGNPVIVSEDTKVTITYEKGTTQDGDTEYTDANNTIIVTILKNSSTITFPVQTIQDSWADNGEKFDLTITAVEDKGEFEKINHTDYAGANKTNPNNIEFKNKVTTEILDDSKLKEDGKLPDPNDPDDGKVEDKPQQVILKIVAVDKDGNPIDASGNKITDSTQPYVTTSNVNEGDKAYYKVFAFTPDSTVFNNDTKLADDLQKGTVTISTVSLGATGVTVKSKGDGSEDYISIDKATVSLGQLITVQTIDDYKAETEANETFNVKIDENSYKHPIVDNVVTPLYENVTVHGTGVTTTIVDNDATTTGTRVEPTEDNIVDGTAYGKEDTVYAVITSDKASVNEGGTVTYTVKLLDKDGNPVTVTSATNVTVTYTSTETTKDIDTPYGNNETITVEIPVNESSNTFTIKTKDDFLADGENGEFRDESFNLKITDVSGNEFENIWMGGFTDSKNVEHKGDVTTTIKEGVTLGIPENAIVDEDTFDVKTVGSTITDNQSLGIKNPNGDNEYELVFEGLPTFVSNSPAFSTNNGSILTSGGEVIKYQIVGNKITGYIGNDVGTEDQVAENNKVFEIILNKDSDLVDSSSTDKLTKDNYTYTQYKNIDHPVAGSATEKDGEIFVNDDDITFEFGFKITDGPAGNVQTSTVQKFRVTVNDSLPKSENWTEEVNEDGTVKIVISPESFAGGYIEIDGKGGSTYQKLGNTADAAKSIVASINIYDADTTTVIGQLTTAGDGTVLFTPNPDYSNYAVNPKFSYKVSDFDGDTASAVVTIKVNPVTDTPTVTVEDVTSYEDASNYNVKADGNKAEGGNKIPLGLTLPSLSKDQTDQNTDTGDIPEKNGEITLQFTNGNLLQDRLDNTSGAKLFNGTTEIANITKVEGVQIVIVITSGETDVDYTYHHKGITATEPSGAIYLTAAEYAGLTIQHAQDNDRDIKIDINVKSFELNDAGIPLGEVVGTLGKTVGADGIIGTADDGKASMIVKILPVTDDISLNWNNAGGVGSFDTGTKTFTFTPANEGNYFTTPINLQNILTKTSGTELDAKPDLDGSEKRTYTVSGIPEGTVITLGGQSATAGSDGTATIEFDNTNNKVEDPTFTMKLPEQFGGKIVNAKITLSVQDMGADNEALAERGIVKTAEVYFNVDVTPVADISTIQVSQAVGYEDAGRTNSNNENTTTGASTIDAPENGIPLNIKVSSDDKDGSETFNVTISDIPDGGAIYYKGGLYNETGLISGTAVTGVTFTNTAGIKWSLQIETYDNATPPKFIPEHNYKGTVILKVDAVTVDKALGLTTSTQAVATTKNIEVIVKDVADIPINNELKALIDGKYVYKGVESTLDSGANKIMLSDFYQTPTTLASYDSSETLSIAIDMPVGFSFKMGGNGVYEIQNGSYVFKASDVGNVEIVTPKHFSGEADIKITYITTDVSDSKTHDTQPVKIYVAPTPDDINLTSIKTSTIIEDAESNKLNFEVDKVDADGSETITHVKISKASIDAVADKFAFFLDAGMTKDISTKATETIDGVVYYVLTYDEAKNVYAKNTTPNLADKNNNFNLAVKYTVEDKTTKETKTADFDHIHEVKVQAVTDAPTITITDISDKTATVATGTFVYGGVNIDKVTVSDSASNSLFTVKVKTTSDDKDGSEEVQKIEIHGVPKGVTIDGAVFKGYTGTDSGIWIITPTTGQKLNADSLADIKFTVHSDASFEGRILTIKTFTKDIDASEETNFVSIRLDGFKTGGEGNGNSPKFELTALTPKVLEDTALTLDKFYSVANTNSGNVTGSSWAVTITGLTPGTTVTTDSGISILTYEQDGQTHYVISGKEQDAEAIMLEFAKVTITPPSDMNTGGEKSGKMTMDGTISSSNGAGSHQGSTVPLKDADNELGLIILPITDDMKITVEAAHTNEDEPTNLKITLSNPSDGTKAALVGNSVTIKVIEDWKDDATGGGAKGTLTSTTHNVQDNGDGTYTITPKSGTYNTSSVIDGLVYTPATNRDGKVDFEVTVQNIENHNHGTHDSTTKTSKGEVSVNVTPVIDVKTLSDIKITATSTEDTVVGTLKNAVLLDIKSTTDTVLITDGSEKMGNIILDGVPNGFVVYYKVGADLVMATNIGKSGTDTFNLNPNIDLTVEPLTHKNKWLIPNGAGGIPEVYINAPENWSGDFAFNTNFTITEQNLGVSKSFVVPVEGKITPVADGVTIDPTLTFGDAFSWVDLKLNANMKDVDGSETMSLEITKLSNLAQFRYEDGTMFDGIEGRPNATYADSKWTITGITFDQINNIQLINDKSVSEVGVKAWTVEGSNASSTKGTALEVDGTFNIDLKGYSENNIKLGEGVSLNFDNIGNIATEATRLQGVTKIDLSAAGKNEILNLTLQDVLDMSGSSKEIKITGTGDDKVTFAAPTDWTKTTDSGFNIYTNTSDNTVKVKVQTEINDQII